VVSTRSPPPSLGGRRSPRRDQRLRHHGSPLGRTTWTREPTPNGNPGGFNNLSGVAAAGGTVWAVGTYVDPNSSTNRRKLILQRTGGSWRVSAAPIAAAYEQLAAVDATGPADAWAVASATTDSQGALVPLALRWNGTSWVSMAPPLTLLGM
jgi:hypothetical protein